MFYSIVALSLCFINSALASGARSFEENGNAFERNVRYENIWSSDFIQVISSLVNETDTDTDTDTDAVRPDDDDDDDDGALGADDLRVLRSGLNQYYLTRAFHYFAEKHKLPDERYEPDPCCLPNFHSVEYGDLYFHGVKAYGFPSLRYANRLKSDVRFDARSRTYEVMANVSSDVVVVTGKFNASREEFLFVYQTFDNTYRLRRSNRLASDGLYKLRSVAESFAFEDDQLTHTADSSCEQRARIDRLLYPALKNAMRRAYMPLLADRTASFLQPMVRRRTSADASAYLRQTLDQLMRQLVRCWRRANGDADAPVRLPPLVFSNDRSGDRYEPLRFEDVAVGGLSNFDAYDVLRSTTRSVDHSAVVRMRDEMVVGYDPHRHPHPLAASANQSAYLEFTFRAGKRKARKRYKISAISVTTECEMLLDRYPPRIRPLNVGGGGGGGGYQISIEFRAIDLDDAYVFMLHYLNEGISKAVTNALTKNEFS